MASLLTKCDYEPIHLIPFIQDAGVHFLVEPQWLDIENGNIDKRVEILQTSANSQRFGFGPAESLIGSDFMQHFSDENKLDVLRCLVEINREECEPHGLTANPLTRKLPSGVEIARKWRQGNLWWEDWYTEEDHERYLSEFSKLSERVYKLCTVQREFGRSTLSLTLSFTPIWHAGRKLVIVESDEPGSITDSPSSPEELKSLVDLVKSIMDSKTKEEVCRLVVDLISRDIGFSRVMFLKYNIDGIEVTAEKVIEKELPSNVKYRSFDGMRFPGGDIPFQARVLLQRTQFRYIRDVSKPQCALVPEVVAGIPINLTESDLRQQSQLHLQYLKNMGVKSSATCAIGRTNNMVGMISCHSYSPTCMTRSQMQRMRTYAAVCTAALNNVDSLLQSQEFVRVDNLFNQHDRANMSIEELIKLSNVWLLKQLKAESIVYVNVNMDNLHDMPPILIGSQSTVFGAALEDKWIQKLLSEEKLFSDYGQPKTFESIANKFSSLLPEPALECIGGVATLHFATSCIIIVRAPVLKSETWAGKPTKTETVDDLSSMPLTPRHSFAAYIKKVDNCSLPWTSTEVSMLNALYNRLLLVSQRDLAIKNETQANLFVSRINHEMRTPLNGILGSIDLLGLIILDSQAYGLLKTIEFSADMLLSIVEDVLTLKKEESNLTLELVRFNLLNILNTAIDVVSSAHCRRMHVDVEIQNHTQDVSWEGLVISDARRICQVIINLLSNAFKFRRLEPDDKIEVSVNYYSDPDLLFEHVERIHRDNITSETLEAFKSQAKIFRSEESKVGETDLDSERYIFVSVKDNGIGIKLQDLTKLFKRFSQLDSGPTRNFQGTGLGLHICRQLTQLIGGNIGCAISKEGHPFTIFYFAIKVIDANGAPGVEQIYTKEQLSKLFNAKIVDTLRKLDMQKYTPSQSIQEATEVSTQITSQQKVQDGMNEDPIRVLLVDDYPINLRTISSMMKRVTQDTNVVITTCSSGKEAVEFALNETKGIDLCLCDYHMPGIDGITTGNAVRALSPKVQFYVATADVSENVKTLAKENNFLGVLTKPIRLRELREIWQHSIKGN